MLATSEAAATRDDVTRLAYVHEALALLVDTAAALCTSCTRGATRRNMAQSLMDLAVFPLGGRVARATAIRASANVALVDPAVANTFQCSLVPAILACRGGTQLTELSTSTRRQHNDVQSRMGTESSKVGSVGYGTAAVLSVFGQFGEEIKAAVDADADYLWQVILGCAPFVFTVTNATFCARDTRGTCERPDGNVERMLDSRAMVATEGLGSSAQRILSLMHEVGLRDEGGVVTSRRIRHILQAQVSIDSQL